jgi:beta-N-acetylhexosaminidase
MDGDGNFDGFSAMGFDVMHTFEEVSCDAATWTMIPPA